VLDTNNLLFWLYIHVPATIEFCFVVARITNAEVLLKVRILFSNTGTTYGDLNSNETTFVDINSTSLLEVSTSLPEVLDTNNLLFWLYIHVPATIEFCFVVARITNAENTHFYCPAPLLVTGMAE
jgi:hypothetical protein